MKLQRAISLDRMSTVGDELDERDERRSRRRSERRNRRTRRRRRRARRSRQRADRLDHDQRPRRRRRRQPRERDERPMVRSAQAEPVEPWQAQAQPPAWQPDPSEAALEPMAESWDQAELPFEEELMGFAWPRVQRARQRLSRSERQQAGGGRWSPPARMGTQLRIQAKAGHRAAVIELKPGLYLVAQVPDSAARPEFGLAPLLAPLMVKAASRVMTRRQARQAQQPGEQAQRPGQRFWSMFHHPQAGQPQPVQPTPAPQAQARPVAQLPGPVVPGQAWATVPGPQGQAVLVQLPDPVAWDEDDEPIAGALALIPYGG